MSLCLPPELERIVEENVASGKYGSPMEFIQEALRLIVERDRLIEAQRESLRRDIAIGLEQLTRGQYAPFNREEIMERVKQRLERDSLNVTLPPELERIVKESVATGRYSSINEVLREALLLMQERDLFGAKQRESLLRDLDEGIEQLDRGEYVTPTREEIIKRVARRIN
jgi:antitoxin ParD1/3/4